MRFDVDLPEDYQAVYQLPMFDSNNLISERVRKGLLNVLYVYTNVAKVLAKNSENNPDNYRISGIYIVGSGARENRIDSDMDLLFVTPSLEKELQRNMKGLLSMIFFNDLQKRQAIDLYFVSSENGIYQGRARSEITDQVQEILNTFNENLRRE